MNDYKVRITITEALEILDAAYGIVEGIEDRFGFHPHEARLSTSEPLNAVKEALTWLLERRAEAAR